MAKKNKATGHCCCCCMTFFYCTCLVCVCGLMTNRLAFFLSFFFPQQDFLKWSWCLHHRSSGHLAGGRKWNPPNRGWKKCLGGGTPKKGTWSLFLSGAFACFLSSSSLMTSFGIFFHQRSCWGEGGGGGETPQNSQFALLDLCVMAKKIVFFFPCFLQLPKQGGANAIFFLGFFYHRHFFLHLAPVWAACGRGEAKHFFSSFYNTFFCL